MSKIDDGGPAFWVSGMSLRDYFAAHAPESEKENFDNNDPRDPLGWKWRYANAMIRARKEEQ